MGELSRCEACGDKFEDEDLGDGRPSNYCGYCWFDGELHDDNTATGGEGEG